MPFLGDGFSKPILVDLLGRYSNLSDQGELLERLLEIAPEGSPTATLQTARQVQRRLRSREVDELVAGYQAGLTVYELAERHRVDRKTVSIILERQGVPRRYRLIEGEQLAEAIKAYESGSSLATIGAHMGVSPYTIRRALLGAGVTIRTRPGWD